MIYEKTEKGIKKIGQKQKPKKEILVSLDKVNSIIEENTDDRSGLAIAINCIGFLTLSIVVLSMEPSQEAFGLILCLFCLGFNLALNLVSRHVSGLDEEDFIEDDEND